MHINFKINMKYTHDKKVLVYLQDTIKQLIFFLEVSLLQLVGVSPRDTKLTGD